MKTKRRHFVTVFAVLFSLLCARETVAAERRIASVNVDRVFEQYFKTQLVNERLERRAKELLEERTKLVQACEPVRTKLWSLQEASQDTSLGMDVRQEKTAEAQETLARLRDMESQITDLTISYTKELEDMGQRLHNDLIDDITAGAKEYAEEKGIDLVVDSSAKRANGVGVVLHADHSLDITGIVIERLNVTTPESKPVQQTSDPEMP